MKFNLIVGIVLLVVAVSAFHLGTNDKNSRIIYGTKRLPTASQLKAYHQRKRAEAVKMHKNYDPVYPKQPPIAIIKIRGKLFVLALESGSDTVWVLDKSYPNSSVKKFDPTGSVSVGDFQAESGTAELRGKKYIDIVNFFNDMNQTFGSVSEVTGEWYDPVFKNASGGFGLAWDPAKKDDKVDANSAPVLNLFTTDKITTRIMGQISTNRNSTHSGYAIAFGGRFPFPFDCKVEPVVVVPLSYNEKTKEAGFQLDSFAFGDQKIDGDLIKVDTGSCVIYVPSNAFDIIYSAIQPDYDYDTGVYTTSCSNIGKFDDFVFTIGGVDLRITSNFYVVDLGFGDGQCAVAFATSNEYTTPYALGTPILDMYCIQYSIDDTTVGFYDYLS